MGFIVTVDENIDPGRYGFKFTNNELGKVHYFSLKDHTVFRGWIKALMKATIIHDNQSALTISRSVRNCMLTISIVLVELITTSMSDPTVPIGVAQNMKPRPPSPTQRDAAQRTIRRENPRQLSARDARILMGFSGVDDAVPGMTATASADLAEAGSRAAEASRLPDSLKDRIADLGTIQIASAKTLESLPPKGEQMDIPASMVRKQPRCIGICSS
jgi:hypothetical protein